MVHTVTRRHPRFPLRLPVLWESPTIPGHRTMGLTYNVSQGGLLLEVARPLAPGTPMSLLLSTGDQNTRAEAVVIWRAEDIPCRMGLRFTAWEGTDRLIWDRLLSFQAGPTRRASVRIPIALEVPCRISPETYLSGRIENLGDGGLMITLPQAFPPPARLTVGGPPLSTLPPVEMEVVWAGAVPEGPGVRHGLRFCAEDIPKELFLIGTLLQQLIDQEEWSRMKKGAG